MNQEERLRIEMDTTQQLGSLHDAVLCCIVMPNADDDADLLWLHKQTTSFTRRWQERQQAATAAQLAARKERNVEREDGA